MQPLKSSKCNHVYYPESCIICSNKIKDWKFYAKELVITPEEKRIDYLYEFIKDKIKLKEED